MALRGRPKRASEKIEEISEEPIEGLEEEDLDEEDLEKLEAEEKKKVQKKITPKKPIIKQRYVVFSQPPRVGIVDNETGEIIGEGEILIPQVLTNILERLERIEANIGSMLEE